MRRIIIAIDGQSSTGKSTLAKQIAQTLGYQYIDTGAMYRALTLYAIRNGFFDEERLDSNRLIASLSTIEFEHVEGDPYRCNLEMNGEKLEPFIRTLEVARKVSHVAKIEEVRVFLTKIQRQWGITKEIVMDGRDIGTVVFPQAEVKIFMKAAPHIRAQRRYEESLKKGESVLYEQVLDNILERDRLDSTRMLAPLKIAEDAVLIDNSNLTLAQQFDKAMEIIMPKVK